MLPTHFGPRTMRRCGNEAVTGSYLDPSSLEVTRRLLAAHHAVAFRQTTPFGSGCRRDALRNIEPASSL